VPPWETVDSSPGGDGIALAGGPLAHEAGALGDLERVPELLLVGRRITEAEVVRDGAGEQIGLLRHEADGGGDVGAGEVGDRHPVQQHLAAGRVVQARDEADQRGLADRSSR
jgi:hypothetical protein